MRVQAKAADIQRFPIHSPAPFEPTPRTSSTRSNVHTIHTNWTAGPTLESFKQILSLLSWPTVLLSPSAETQLTSTGARTPRPGNPSFRSRPSAPCKQNYKLAFKICRCNSLICFPLVRSHRHPPLAADEHRSLTQSRGRTFACGLARDGDYGEPDRAGEPDPARVHRPRRPRRRRRRGLPLGGAPLRRCRWRAGTLRPPPSDPPCSGARPQIWPAR